jgi:hypothetical protein
MMQSCASARARIDEIPMAANAAAGCIRRADLYHIVCSDPDIAINETREFAQQEPLTTPTSSARRYSTGCARAAMEGSKLGPPIANSCGESLPSATAQARHAYRRPLRRKMLVWEDDQGTV